MRYLIVLAALTCSAFAEAGLQDDWSGGPGIPGPVSEWSNEFSSSTMINWSDLAGSLILGQMSSYHLVRQISDLMWAKPCQLSDDEYPDVFVRYGEYSSNWYKNESSGNSWAIRNVSDTHRLLGKAHGLGDHPCEAGGSLQSGIHQGKTTSDQLTTAGISWASVP